MIWTYDCCTTGIVSYTHDSPQPMWHSSPALTWSSWPVCCCWASPAWTRPCHGWWWERSPSDTASCCPWRRSWEAWSPAGTDSECGADRDHTHRSLVSAALTGMCGSVMVTSSPFPTCSSPSQDVSMDAGLKSSEDESTGSETLEFVFKNYYKNITIHAYYFCWWSWQFLDL